MYAYFRAKPSFATMLFGGSYELCPHTDPRLASKCAYSSKTFQRPELRLKDGRSYPEKERGKIILKGRKTMFKLRVRNVRVRNGKLQV